MNYLLLTPAYNEKKYIELTINSVLSQTCKPSQWIIISDGSTDGTDEIIIKYALKNPLITYIRYFNTERYYSNLGKVSKKVVACIREGLKHIISNEYQFIGIIDADVTIKSDFFEKILIRFSENDNLGLAGGFIYNVQNNKKWPYFCNPEQVGGPLQLFRRTCWDQIEGLYPGGHHDYYAVASCKMNGWKVKSFSELEISHHKHASSEGRSQLKAKFHLGCMDYVCGELFFYSLLRAFTLLYKKPIIIGSILRISGFIYSALRKTPQQVPLSLKDHLHKEQLNKIIPTSIFKYWK